MLLKKKKKKSNATCPPCVPWLLKLPLNQIPIEIYPKFNSDFKSHINFEGYKRNTRKTCSITQKNMFLTCQMTHVTFLEAEL
jgi:hypothetical protein